MKHTRILTTGILVVLFSLTTNVFAQRGQKECRDNDNNRSDRFKEMMDLSDDQVEDIKALKTKHFSVMDELRSDMEIVNSELKDITSGEDYNLNAALKKVDEITSLKNKMMKVELKHRDEVRNLLTDEQKVIFDKQKPRGRRDFNKDGKRGGKGMRGMRGDFQKEE